MTDLAALADNEAQRGNSREAGAFRNRTREIIICIANPIGDEALRASFLGFLDTGLIMEDSI